MKVVEKVSYVEARVMNLVLDEHEAIRHISQVLHTADSTEMMATQVEQIGELWVSARQRTKDTPGERLVSDCKKIVKCAVEYEMQACEAKVAEFETTTQPPEELRKSVKYYKLCIQSLNEILEIDWAQRIHRLEWGRD